MKIAVVGTGYVGLVVGTGFAESGHQVTCVDRNASRIERLREGHLPIYEPGLEELVLRNVEEERLTFSTDIAEAVADCLLVFLCVGMPEEETGTDISEVLEAAEQVGKALGGYRIIVNKSTCPVGTAERVRETIAELTSHPFDVVANPDYLKEGAAVDDFMRPDRVVVGCDDVRVLEIMRELYAPYLRTGKPFLSMSIRSAELSKYAVDTMLAARISLMNELANLAEAYGADIREVQNVLMADERLGASYLFPGIGFGGAWLAKDAMAAAQMAREKGLPCGVLEGITETNQWQLEAFLGRILEHFGDSIAEKRIALWGASFKPKTDDLRNAPALHVIDGLLEAGASLNVFDPVAGSRLKKRYGDRIELAPKMYAGLEGADALVIVTEWREFHNPDFERMAGTMQQKVIFDGRNLYEPKTMAQHGFRYYAIGRPHVEPGV